VNNRVSFPLKNVILFFSTVFPFGLLFSSAINAQTWEKTNGPNGGTVYSLVISNSQDIFAGTDSGIFISSDKGENWINILSTEDEFRSLAINSVGDIFAGDYHIFNMVTLSSLFEF
jgi:ligand-binding sensor domain-containing protein